MDEHEHPRPTSSSSPRSPSASFVSAAGGGGNNDLDQLVLEFPYTEVPEQWLMDYDYAASREEHGHGDGRGAAAWADEGSLSAGSAADLYSGGNPPPAAAAAAAAPATKRRGRKKSASTGPSSSSTGIPAFSSHVEAERQRRDKLHRRFCDLRAAVPTVTRMDKASILADATAYIADLRARVDQLQADAATRRAAAAAVRRANPFVADDAGGSPEIEEKLEVRMVAGAGQQEAAAALRLTTTTRHAPAHLMVALRALDLGVQHACVCRVGGVTVQDAVVDVPAALRDEGCLRAALLHRLQQSSSS